MSLDIWWVSPLLGMLLASGEERPGVLNGLWHSDPTPHQERYKALGSPPHPVTEFFTPSYLRTQMISSTPHLCATGGCRDW